MDSPAVRAQVERRPRRRLERALIVSVGAVLVVGALLWALPEIIRRVALDQIPRHTDRAVAIEDIDLNVFTGRVRITNLRLAERQGAQAFVELERLDARLAATALLRSDVRLTEVALVAPSVRVIRTEPGEFNFSDLLQLAAAAWPPAGSDAGPSRWTVTVDRLTISNGAVLARDEAVAPPAEWEIRDLRVDAGDLTTRVGAAPGWGTMQARIDEATLDVTAETLRLAPLAAVVTVALDGFELRRLGPYIARGGSPYRLKGGRLGMALTATVDHVGEELAKAALSGTVNVEREAVARTEQDDPFLDIARVDVTVKEADAITRSLTVGSVAIEGAALRARRDARGVIDLMDMFRTNGPAALAPGAGAPAPPVPRRLFPVLGALAPGFEQILVERVTLGPSTVTWVDEAVTPTTTLALTGMQATLTDLTWPSRGPAILALSTGLPGGGTFRAQGPVVPQPFDADLAFTMRNAPVQPYQAYIPIRGQLRGRYSGDGRHRIALRDGRMVLASKGNGWAEGVEIRVPGASRPAISVERMDLVGIDFDWPTHARVARASFRRPRVEIVREADRSFDVAKLFTAPDVPGAEREARASPQPAALPRTERRKGLLETMRLDFEEIRVEDGFVRFLDRTTQPAFSKDLSRLTVAVDDLSNRPDERARLAVQSIVGGDSTLDVQGELGAIGSPAFVDLVGELGSLQLASFNPYAEAAIGWMIKQGELQYKVRFVLDGDALQATNEFVLGQLQVAPAGGADQIKQRIGLPLDYIVALAKDGNGEIRATVPVAGSISDPTFDMRATIAASIRKAVANLVQAPFRTISRLVRRGNARIERGDGGIEVPTVDPVTFAAGSSVIAPDMEQHLLRVADVLRRSPFVNLALAPAPGAADVEALRPQALAARLRAFQEERGLPDGPGVVATYFAERFPNVKPPATAEEQLALLREREPAPEHLLADLARRRVDVARERLVSVEGIPAERLEIGEPRPDPAPLPADAAGRVEFAVVAGGE